MKFVFVFILMMTGAASIGVGLFGEGTAEGALTGYALTIVAFFVLLFLIDDDKK